ncbi:MAG: histidine kinase [Anaerolineales bacterium]
MAAVVRLSRTLPWPALARIGWILFAGISLGVLLLMVPINSLTIYSSWRFQASYPVLADLLTRRTYALYFMGIHYGVAAICYLVAGLIVWRRANDLVPWLAAIMLATLPVMFSLGGYSETWSYYPHPWRDVLKFLREALTWSAGLTSLLAFLFLFPNSRSLARWTPVLLGLVLSVSILTSIALFRGIGPDPYGFWFAGFIVALLLGAGVQVHRYRRIASPLERQQTKWVVAGLVTMILSLVGVTGLSMAAENTLYTALAELLSVHLSLLTLALFPLSIAFSIFRYRLWAIDLLLNRALVYVLLTASVLTLYVLLVIAAGIFLQNPANPVLAAIAIGVLAMFFQPMRQRLQTAVNRLMYGERDDPVTALARLGQRLEASLAPGRELTTIVETVAQALRLPYVSIEIKTGEEYASAASAGTFQPKAELIALVYQGQLIGQLVVAPRATGESFSAADRRLLTHLARQAAPAVHAHRLAADLQHSRERIVVAREEERRRLRRDLHDGFGPTLASQALKLDAAIDLLASDPATAGRLLSEVKAQTQGTVADVRRLVYALRPPALDELGLVGALQSQIQALPANGLRLSLEAAPLPPLSAAVEVAAFRITLEAVTNTVRHAHASECRVRLAAASRALEIEVEDNGVGLPPEHAPGDGLVSLRERTAELGGTCRVENRPEGGVRVAARLPLAPAEHG